MYKITLTKEDFLQNQLYNASMSSEIKKQRRRSWFILTAAFLRLGILLLIDSTSPLGYWSIGVAIITLLLYPFYQRRRYRKHYENYLTENYGNRFGQESTLTFADGYLINYADDEEIKLSLERITTIIELPNCIYIRMESGSNLIIPANTIGYSSLVAELKSYAGANGKEWQLHEHWRWR